MMKKFVKQALKKYDMVDVLLNIQSAWNSVECNKIINCWKNCYKSYISTDEERLENEDINLYDNLDVEDENFINSLSEAFMEEIKEEIELKMESDIESSHQNTFYEIMNMISSIEEWCKYNDQLTLKELYDLKEALIVRRKRNGRKISDFFMKK